MLGLEQEGTKAMSFDRVMERIDDAAARLTRAGFDGVDQASRDTNVPLQLVVGRRAGNDD